MILALSVRLFPGNRRWMTVPRVFYRVLIDEQEYRNPGRRTIDDAHACCLPFSIITGCLAVSINASYLASAAGTFSDQTNLLLHMWSELVSSQVIKTDPLTLGRLGLGWVKDLSTGGIGRSDALNRRAEIIDFFND